MDKPIAASICPERLSKSGVKIVMANVSRNKKGFHLEFHEISDYKEEGSVLKEVNEFYEKFILKSPDAISIFVLGKRSTSYSEPL